MATIKGREAVSRYLRSLPGEMERKVLRGAARAAANIVADEARRLVTSEEVRASIKTAVRKDGDRIVAKVRTQGKGAFIAPWLEYGTAPHFISVDESQRQGMSIGRINRQHKAGSLVINGQFVGETVFHPGAKPHPFMRPALDTQEAAAIAAAQAYINASVSRDGITGTPDPEDNE